MSDERDEDKKKEEDEPVKQLAEGIGMLLKAAKGAAKGLKKELDKTTVSKVFEDAGREFARAATNVVEQVSAEISGKKKHESHAPPPHDEPHEHAAPKDHDEGDEFDGVKPTTPKASTPSDPGVRIAVDDDDEKKSG